ncbi:tetratricopeptide repeat protein [Aromatoleum evansii]|uniref:Tetratricopeptide repeat protein n=1 Tax=Aromatoleum evansii TaxID=59406 RepID=A0ABZ1ALJ0_AROEV|nr:tetratricopeptide repeat protein [Aromatoleum evansii]
MLRRLSFCMMLLAGAVHAAPIEDALRHYDGGQFEAAAQQLAPLAEGGNPVAQERLAIMYFYGRGVPEDEDKALQWARRSADQGNLDAMYFIGNMYVFGDKLPKSVQDPDQEAARWYFEAARKGHAEAEYGLGLLFLAGKGVVQDQEEAMRWIRSAADHGHPGARSFLGGSKGSGH